MKPIHRRLALWLLFLSGLILLTLSCLAQTPAGPEAGAPGATASSQTLPTWWQALIPVAVPLILVVLKLLVPKTPPWLLPILCPVLGAVMDILTSGAIGGGTVWGAALGGFGNNLREIVDQLRKAQAARTAAALIVGFCLLTFASGCKTTPTPESTAYRTLGSTATLVEAARQSWVSYVTQQRTILVGQQLADLEDNVARGSVIYGQYQQAMRTAHDAVAAYKAAPGDQAPLNTALAAVAASSSNFCALIKLITGH